MLQAKQRIVILGGGYAGMLAAARIARAGGRADVTLVDAKPDFVQAAGPQSPTYAGFEANNTALPLNGLKQWASLNNPSGLNISGQITLEAWVEPDAVQGSTARIISHGPPNQSLFDLGTYPLTLTGALANSNQVFLKIETPRSIRSRLATVV